MPAKTEFDRLVEELRPATPPRLTSKRKADCTPEEWAAKLNYLRDRKRRDHVRESAKAYNRRYRERNAQRLLEAQRERRQRDADRLREWHKAYAQRRRDARLKYEQEVLRHRTEHMLASRLRTRLWAAIKAAGAGKAVSAVNDSGMTAKQLRAHIEAQFAPGMSWDNAGEGWHLDHWFPLAAANLEDPIEQQAVCHFSNLRPIWAHENLSKNDSVEPEARENFERVVAMLRRQASPITRGGALRKVAASALDAVAGAWRALRCGRQWTWCTWWTSQEGGRRPHHPDNYLPGPSPRGASLGPLRARGGAIRWADGPRAVADICGTSGNDFPEYSEIRSRG